jgi:acetyl-CoA C-acetyltransferase
MEMKESQKDAVILSAARTPSGRFQGSLKGFSAPQLGAFVIKAAIERANLLDLTIIDEVLMGNVVSCGLGQAPARQAAIFSGLPETVGATTINKVCGSGLKTAMIASQAIHAEEGHLFICGGMENMSRAPFIIDHRVNPPRFGHTELKDSLLYDGLWDPFEQWGMGNAAEFIAEEYEITREAMDEFALNSHRKAIEAIDCDRFKSEIVPIEISDRKGNTSFFDTDETPRRDTSLESLEKLKPAFENNGKVTAGNSPGLNDGASALVLASRRMANRLGIQPLAKIVGYAQAAVAPKYLFDAPSKAIPVLLEKVGWRLDEVDLIEINEAFAAQVLANGKALEKIGWNWNKVNIHGGAIALGHPIGASGARVLTTLLYALKATDGTRGIVVLCLGGAEAVAMAVEIQK